MAFGITPLPQPSENQFLAAYSQTTLTEKVKCYRHFLKANEALKKLEVSGSVDLKNRDNVILNSKEQIRDSINNINSILQSSYKRDIPKINNTTEEGVRNFRRAVPNRLQGILTNIDTLYNPNVMLTNRQGVKIQPKPEQITRTRSSNIGCSKQAINWQLEYLEKTLSSRSGKVLLSIFSAFDMLKNALMHVRKMVNERS